MITSIVRFAGFFSHDPTVDVTYTAVYLLIYSVCECSLYLVAACLPTYRPLASLFRRDGSLSIAHLKSQLSTSENSTSTSETPDLPLATMGNTKSERLYDDKVKSVRAGGGGNAV